MPKVLTQSQVDAYHRDGFVFPIDVMTSAEAASLRSQLEDAESRYPETVNAQNRNNSHVALKCVDEIVHHAGILDAIEDLIGPDILAWGSVLFIKEPDAKSFVSWHQDMTPEAQDARTLNNEHWATMLYKGAAQKRAY